MEIRIPLIMNTEIKSYSEIKSNLKQLELAVHHAQKSVEAAEKEGIEVTESSFVCFSFPFIERPIFDQEDTEEIKNFMREFAINYNDDLQNVELRIVLE